MEAPIRLFKSVLIEQEGEKRPFDEELAKETLPLGFIFAPNVPNPRALIEVVEAAYGRAPEKINNAFHKSFAKVRDASDEQLVIEQVLHYLTTYGAEHYGVFSHDNVFVPAEELDIPEIKVEGFRVVIIKGLTKEDLKDKLFDLLVSGVALGEDTLADAVETAQLVGFTEADVAEVANNEAKVALYDYLGVVPSAPIDFLRYIVFKATNQTLLIKSPRLIVEISERNNTDIVGYLDRYERDHGFARLAEIFYRFKPLFLAMRTTSPLRKKINRIRRLAEKNHKPMRESYLDTVTGKIARGEDISLEQLQKELEKVNTFRKIRLAYALKYRTTDADSIMYRIRNGKSYVTEFAPVDKSAAERLLSTVNNSIAADLSRSVAGKKVYIPEYMRYALPATERQFTGNIPSGSSILVERDMIAGVHWENQGRKRIDLDLSLTSVDGKIGWDGGYRSGNRTVLFSGDLIDAPLPKGASELFYLTENARGAWLMNLNYYNFDPSTPVPFKLLVGHDEPTRMDKEYVLDPNKVVSATPSEISEKQKVIGLIVANDQDTRFYFSETNIAGGISARNTEQSTMARNYLIRMYTDSISLNDLLVLAGAEIVTERPAAEELEDVIDLSPETVERDSLLKLFYG